jgi:transcriptional antiterminator Rof (Rho-off)
MSDEPYTPIACAFHESLEFAVLRRGRLRLTYRDAAGEHVATVRPTDVATRDGAEWLSYVDEAGEDATLRLDRIIAATPVA